ncbi:unnamed protein product [Moneuplotes crassus]|uniref:Uncharacterized protein n=1 Tax=Euplotes crassus TaxID=5936 RepID=A0AAD2DB83_EUPCR|nr:unnamed protein product [Moneuplotes crassus]
MEPDGLEEWERGDHRFKFSENIPIAYLCFFTGFQVMFLLGLAYSIKRLYSEYRQEYRDRFKIIQMSFIISYLFTKNAYNIFVLFRARSTEFFHLPILALTSFFFYYFEVINDTCWLSFIIHLKYMNNRLCEESISKVIRREKVISFCVSFVAILCLLTWLGIIVASFVYGCYRAECYVLKGDPEFKSNECDHLHTASRVYTIVLFGIGAAAAILKIFIGYIMLSTMKKTLYIPYIRIRTGVAFTVLATLVVISLNAAYNYSNQFSYSIWLVFLLSMKNVSNSQLAFTTITTFCNSFLEVLLMIYTAEKIDFKNYIMILLEGRMKFTLAPRISTFLKLNRVRFCIDQKVPLLTEDEQSDLSRSNLTFKRALEEEDTSLTNFFERTPEENRAIKTQLSSNLRERLNTASSKASKASCGQEHSCTSIMSKSIEPVI